MKQDDDDEIRVSKTTQKALSLAETYESKSAFQPALIIYKSLLKAPQMSLPAKISIGNIHFKLSNYPLAIKYYKMALDQIGQNDKVTYAQVMHNIGLALVQQESYSEASFVFGYIVNECPDLKAYIHLVLCAYARGSASKVRRYFPRIFTIPKITEILPIQKVVFLIATLLERNPDDGFNWCLDVIRVTDHAWIADNLEVARIVDLLCRGRKEAALNHLQKFDLNVENLTEKSRINLSFVFLLLNKLDRVEQLLMDCTNAGAYNNFGVLKLMQGDPSVAKEALQMAIEFDGKFFEPLYNLGLVEKKLGNLNQAETIFEDLRRTFPFPCNPMVGYQMADVRRGKMSAYENLQSNLALLGTFGVPDPKMLRKVGNLYRELANFKTSSWYLQEARSVSPLL